VPLNSTCQNKANTKPWHVELQTGRKKPKCALAERYIFRYKAINKVAKMENKTKQTQSQLQVLPYLLQSISCCQTSRPWSILPLSFHHK